MSPTAYQHLPGFTLVIDVQRNVHLDFLQYLEYRLAVHILCDIVPRPNANPAPKHIVGYVFEFLDNPRVIKDLYDITTLFNFQGIYSTLDESEGDVLRIVVFAFPHFTALQLVVNKHPELRERLDVDGQFTYLFTCQRSAAHTFSKVRVCDREDWVVIDPATLEPTGACEYLFYSLYLKAE